VPADDDEPTKVDDFIPATWPSDAVTALDEWSQGCLIRGSVFGVADREQPRDQPAVLEVEATGFNPAGWMVVVTQTCDLVLTGTGAGQPFAMCSPLLDISGHTANKIQDVKDWKVTYLAPIDDVPIPGEWAVDLRVSVPVSKLALVGIAPILGFPNERDLLRFSDFVALRTRRPALHDALSSGLRDILDDTIKNAPKASHSWYQEVEQVRLEITPSRLEPNWVRIHFLCERELTPDEQDIWRTSEKQIKALFAAHHITYGGLKFDRLADVNAVDYRQWSPLAVPRLNRPPHW
jgi:hypothetical protein